MGPVVGGAPFIGGSDDYVGLWREHGGFNGQGSFARNFNSVKVDKSPGAANKLVLSQGPQAEARPQNCQDQAVFMFVTVEK